MTSIGGIRNIHISDSSGINCSNMGYTRSSYVDSGDNILNIDMTEVSSSGINTSNL